MHCLKRRDWRGTSASSRVARIGYTALLTGALAHSSSGAFRRPRAVADLGADANPGRLPRLHVSATLKIGVPLNGLSGAGRGRNQIQSWIVAL
jgi:hypothetical protein